MKFLVDNCKSLFLIIICDKSEFGRKLKLGEIGRYSGSTSDLRRKAETVGTEGISRITT